MLLELENCNFIRSLVMHKYEWLTCQTEINSTLANYKYIWFSKPFLWEHAESPKRTTQRNLSLPGIVDGVLLCHPLPFRQTLYHWQNIHTTKMHHSTPTDRAIKFVYEYNATIKGIHCTFLIQGSSSASFFYASLVPFLAWLMSFIVHFSLFFLFHLGFAAAPTPPTSFSCLFTFADPSLRVNIYWPEMLFCYRQYFQLEGNVSVRREITYRPVLLCTALHISGSIWCVFRSDLKKIKP